MSQTGQQEQIEYFIQYAGSCLKIWNSIVGQKITHHTFGTGTVVEISKNGDSIYVKILFNGERSPRNFLGKQLGKHFNLRFPAEAQRDLAVYLLRQLRNLSSQPSIDQLTFSTFEGICNQLMWMYQTRKLPTQTIEKIKKYRQKFMDERQKLIDRERFSNLSGQAMNPNVETCFSLPKLDERDLQLAGEWCCPPRYNLDRTSLVKAKRKDSELDRLLSARAAEKVALYFYQHYGKKAKDISIKQIDKSSKSEWEKYDLDVNDKPIDVKNSRQSPKNRDRYTEHYIQKKFRYNKESQDVIIAGVFSPYLWTFELLDKPVEHHQNREVQFLGETTWKKIQVLKNEFKDSVYFEVPNPMGKYLLPPWVFEYPKYVYTERDKTLKELKDFPNLSSLKEATFEFNLIPVCIAAGVDLTQILGSKASEEWEQSFLNQLRNRVEKDELSLPFLFLTILEHFLCMAASYKTVSDFDPDEYRRFLFYKDSYKPLGIYDPLKTIDALIKALSTLWTAENGLIRKFHLFKLRSFNILQGKSDSNEELWTTLIAYCGGRLENGSACGKNPLVLGESKHCEYRRLICPDCGFCCQKCEAKNKLEQTHSKTHDERSRD